MRAEATRAKIAPPSKKKSSAKLLLQRYYFQRIPSTKIGITRFLDACSRSTTAVTKIHILFLRS